MVCLLYLLLGLHDWRLLAVGFGWLVILLVLFGVWLFGLLFVGSAYCYFAVVVFVVCY